MLRNDAGFAAPGLYRFCDSRGIFYVIGLITNDRLMAKTSDLLDKVEAHFLEAKKEQRLFKQVKNLTSKKTIINSESSRRPG